ncbi:MAG TPA: hypothetical protein DEB39_14555 [Planctomycetaceae bacterium]|nr:hypothetical protein [Planctomycetaceae bacterium]
MNDPESTNALSSNQFGPILVGRLTPCTSRNIDGHAGLIGYGEPPLGEKMNGRTLIVFCGPQTGDAWKQ